MSRIRITVVTGTDTPNNLVLQIDEAAIDHAEITRARVVVGAAGYNDSAEFPGAWALGNAGELIAKFGKGNLPAGRHRVRLVTHDANHPDGLAWDTQLELTVL